MKRRGGFLLAWLAVTALSVSVAQASVDSVRKHVTDAAVTVGAAVALPPSTTASTVPATSTTAPSTTAQSTTTVATSSTTRPATTPPTTQAPPSSTTTTAASEKTAFKLVGGSVGIRVSGGSVWFAWAVANVGFTTKVDEQGPDNVKVEFRSRDHTSVFTATVDNGQLKYDVTEQPGGGEHGGGGDD